MRLLEEQQLKSSSLQVGQTKWTMSVVTRVTHSFNEQGLRKALSAKTYDKFTEKVLNRTKLKKAVEEGELDPAVVAQYTEEHVSAPFIQVRHKELDV